jgi:hypothetical protein
LNESVAEVAVGFRIVRVKFEGLLVLGDSVVQLALLNENIAEVVVGFGIVRVYVREELGARHSGFSK